MTSTLQHMIGRDSFRLADGTECRDAKVHGANIEFEYRNVFGWQIAYMPPWTVANTHRVRLDVIGKDVMAKRDIDPRLIEDHRIGGG